MATYQSPIGSDFDIGKTMSAGLVPNQAATSTQSSTPALQQPQQPVGFTPGTPFGSNPTGLLPGLVSSVTSALSPSQTPQSSSVISSLAGAANPFSVPSAHARGPVNPAPPVNGQTTPLAPGQTGTVGNQASPQPAQASPGTPNADGQFSGGQVLPQPGTPEYQSAQELNQNVSSGVTNPNSGYYNPSSSSTGSPSTGFGVNIPTTIPSNVMGSGMSYSDALSARNALMSDATQYLTQTYPGIVSAANLANFNAKYAGDTTQYGTGMSNLVGTQTDIAKQNALIAAQGYGTLLGANAQTLSALQPQALPYSSQLVNPVTGQPVNGAQSGNMQQAVSSVVQGLTNGTMTYDQAQSALSGYGQGGMNALLSALPAGFNPAQSSALAAQQGTIGPAIQYANSALDTLSTAIGSLGPLQNTNVPAVNAVGNFLSTQTGVGSTQTRAYTQAVQEARQSYASVLASVKGGTPTDYSGQAAAAIPDNPTPNDIAAAKQTLATLGASKLSIYGNPGNSSQQSAPSGGQIDWANLQ